MPRRRPILVWTHLAVVAFVTSGRLLVAEDQQTASSDGYRTVNAGGDDGKVPVRVQEDKDPLAAVASHDTNSKYDPERIFSRPSSMAGKSFSKSSDIMNSGHNDYNTSSSENQFVTKPYSFDSKTSTVPGLDTKAAYPTAPVSSRNSNDFTKSFNTASADLGPNQSSSLVSSKAEEQNRSAVLGGHTTDTYASALGNKTFNGSEADAAKKHLTRMKGGQMLVQDLPNRPLTVDEVRDLINHGFKPDTDKAPVEDESKPLNDPNYIPKPIREAPEETAPSTPTARAANDEDKDDTIPSPGMISANAAPENSQPLPQK